MFYAVKKHIISEKISFSVQGFIKSSFSYSEYLDEPQLWIRKGLPSVSRRINNLVEKF